MLHRVCRKWNAVVKKLKRLRKQYAWLWYDETATDITVEESIAEKLENLSFEPRHALLFCSSSLYESTISVSSTSSAGTSRYPRASKMEKMQIYDYMKRVLPPNCRLHGVAADGVVGSSFDGKSVTETEGTKAASCLLLPEMEGIDIYPFFAGEIREEDFKFYASTDTPDPDPEALGRITGIPRDKKPKMVLVFHTEGYVYMDTDVSCAMLKSYNNVVIAGGHVDTLLPEEPMKTNSQHHHIFYSQNEGPFKSMSFCEPVMMGIAFCGENIKVASTVLHSSTRTAKDVEGILQKLKGSHIPEKRSLGFIFACIGRGQHFYNKRNVEADVFRKLFPSTPLLGFFGNGEVGYEFLPDYSSADGAANYTVVGKYPDDDGIYEWDLPEIHHSYSTIFVLLSWNQS